MGNPRPQRFYLLRNLAPGVLHHGKAPYHCLGNNIIKGDFGRYLNPLVQAIMLNAVGVLLVNVMLVDTHQGRDAKVAANAEYSLQIVYSRECRLGYQESHVGPGKG